MTYSIRYSDGDFESNVRQETSIYKDEERTRIKLTARALSQDLLGNDGAMTTLFSQSRMLRYSVKGESVDVESKTAEDLIALGALILVTEQDQVTEGMDVVWKRGTSNDYREEKVLTPMEAGTFLATTVVETNLTYGNDDDAVKLPEQNYVMISNGNGDNASYVRTNGCFYRYGTFPQLPQIPKRSESGGVSVEVLPDDVDLAIECGVLELVKSQDQVKVGMDVIFKRGTCKDHRRLKDKGEKNTYLATKVSGINVRAYNDKDCLHVPEQKYVLVGVKDQGKVDKMGAAYIYSASGGSLTKLMSLADTKIHVGSIDMDFEKWHPIPSDLQEKDISGRYVFGGLRRGLSKEMAVPYYVKASCAQLGLTLSTFLYQSPKTGLLCLATGVSSMLADTPLMTTTTTTKMSDLFKEGTIWRRASNDSRFSSTDRRCIRIEGIIARIFDKYDKRKKQAYQRALISKFIGKEEVLLSMLFAKYGTKSSDEKQLRSGNMLLEATRTPKSDPLKVNIRVVGSGYCMSFKNTDRLCGSYKIKKGTTNYSGSSRHFLQEKVKGSNLKNVLKNSSSKWYLYDESGNRSDNPQWMVKKDDAKKGYLAEVGELIVNQTVRDKIGELFEQFPPMHGWQDNNHGNDVKPMPPFYLVFENPNDPTLRSSGAKIATQGVKQAYSRECWAEDSLTEEDEEEIDEMFQKQKKSLILLDEKPVLRNLAWSISRLTDGLSKKDFDNLGQKSKQLLHKICMIATKLQPHNRQIHAVQATSLSAQTATFSERVEELVQKWRTPLKMVVNLMRLKSKRIRAAKQTMQLLKEFYVSALQSQ
jgi:hypothetical protein